MLSTGGKDRGRIQSGKREPHVKLEKINVWTHQKALTAHWHGKTDPSQRRKSKQHGRGGLSEHDREQYQGASRAQGTAPKGKNRRQIKSEREKQAITLSKT